VPQHQSWNNGAMDGFLSSRLPVNSIDAVLSMGYYARPDLPNYYALGDAFTICDNYFCSVMGPTDPNRLYTMAASLDPDGKNGGPILQSIVTNRPAFYGRLTYTTIPEQRARDAGPDRNRQSGDYRSDWIGFSRPHADHLTVQSRRVRVIGPIRSHFSLAIPRDSVRC
jgi:phospholipase C